MRSLAFLSIVFALSLSSQTAAQPAPPACTPKSDTLTARTVTTAELLPSNQASCTRLRPHGEVSLLHGLATRGGSRSEELVLGVLDITAPCLVTQVEATVPNGQQVGIQLLAAADDVCTATPTFKSDPKPDYISTITSFLKPAAVFATKSFTVAEIVTPPEQRLSLPPAASGTMTVAITCKPKPDAQSPQDSKAPQTRTVVVHYKDPPQFSASAGTLVSLYGKHVFGVSTSQTGVNSSGVATTQNAISLTTSNVQLVPIGFLNTYISGTNRLHLDLQAGLGINPNGSKNEVEYFFGPALTSHGIYFAPGCTSPAPPTSGAGFRWERSSPPVSLRPSTTVPPTASPLPSPTRLPSRGAVRRSPGAPSFHGFIVKGWVIVAGCPIHRSSIAMSGFTASN